MDLWKPDAVSRRSPLRASLMTAAVQTLSWLLAHATHVAKQLDENVFSAAPFDQVSHVRFSGPVPDRLRLFGPYEFTDMAVSPLPEEFHQRRGPPPGAERYVMLDDQQLAAGHPLLMFLRTLLPWVHVQQDDMWGDGAGGDEWDG